MKKLMELITERVKESFVKCGYDEKYGMVTLSNRPDLSEFQCNGALGAAKIYKESPFRIASEVVATLKEDESFKEVKSIAPGFININVSDEFLIDFLNQMNSMDQFGCEQVGSGKTIILDYGGPNVAKPLHVGHLRTAIIGESIKRIGRFLGYKMLGDVHLGDWGLQIGLIIAELRRRYPELVYFDESYTGEYPIEPPFDITELEEIYPAASSLAKESDCFMQEASQTTYLFQNGNKGYVALWKHILKVSIEDLKQNYEKLNVHFDLWGKESDAQRYIPEMIEQLQAKGLAYISEGALVVDVKQISDTKEMPPCILVKSNGATLYSTTDLATIVERIEKYNPDEIIYIVDKRQEMHFEQVFRCAKKTHLINPSNKLTFVGFGTMNGKDGKPFKTRDGGVMRLESLIKSVYEKVYERIMLSQTMTSDEALEVAKKVGLSALKYGDLSNQVSKDYVFDKDKFTSFEGNTGPYILYTVVRIESILNKFYETHEVLVEGAFKIQSPKNSSERALMIKLTGIQETISSSFEAYEPHRICQYIYELANAFNRFYHENKILSEQDSMKQLSWIKLISLTKEILITCLDLLGIEVPDKM